LLRRGDRAYAKVAAAACVDRNPRAATRGEVGSGARHTPAALDRSPLYYAHGMKRTQRKLGLGDRFCAPSAQSRYCQD